MAATMMCGHTTHAVDANGHPICIACVGILPGARDVMPEGMVLQRTAGRMMVCSYTRTKSGGPHPARETPRPSDPAAAFFTSLPDKPMDEFYCGCWGWD